MIRPSIGACIGSRTPVIVVGTSSATFAIIVDAVQATVTTPSGVRAGDTILIFVSTETFGGLPASGPSGFVEESVLTSSANAQLVCYRRTADGTEASTYDLLMASPNTNANVVMLVYRGISTIDDSFASAITDVLGSTSFPCPSLTMTSASDLYIGIVASFGDPVSFNQPQGSVERIDVIQTPDESTGISVFDMRTGVIGATGSKTATSSNSVSGIAASIAFKSI